MFCLTKYSHFFVFGVSPFIKIIQSRELSSSQRCQNLIPRNYRCSARAPVLQCTSKEIFLMFPYTSPNSSGVFHHLPRRGFAHRAHDKHARATIPWGKCFPAKRFIASSRRSVSQRATWKQRRKTELKKARPHFFFASCFLR